jgi:hypothetical protein
MHNQLGSIVLGPVMIQNRISRQRASGRADKLTLWGPRRKEERERDRETDTERERMRGNEA